MPENRSTAPAPSVPASKASRRPHLPYPAAPKLVVKLSPDYWDGLERLSQLTGQYPAESAAALLEQRLLPNPTSAPVPEIARTLRTLFLQRCHRLGTKPSMIVNRPPAHTSSSATNAAKAGRVRIPLSGELNWLLYRMSVDSGLSRRELARECLMVAITDSRNMIQELEDEADRVKAQNHPAPDEEPTAGATREDIS